MTAAFVETGVWQDRGLSRDAAAWRASLLFASERAPMLSTAMPTREALVELERVYEEARVSDWDGLGATAVNPATMGYALAFLASMPAGTPTPEVTADPDGELVFEWDGGARRVFAVAIGTDGTMNFAGLLGYDVTKGSCAFRGVLPAAVIDGIRRVAKRA